MFPVSSDFEIGVVGRNFFFIIIIIFPIIFFKIKNVHWIQKLNDKVVIQKEN
jgi:hypothetical protein